MVPPPPSTKPRRRAFIAPLQASQPIVAQGPRPTTLVALRPTAPVALRPTAPLALRPTAPAHPRLTAPTHPRPPAPAPRRPTAPLPPRPTGPPPPHRTVSARQETPAFVAGLGRKIVHDVLPPPQPVLPPPQEPPPYESPFRNATACDARDDFNLTPMPLFHWKPDYSEYSRPSSSQYFTNLMTQDKDADLELLMQPDLAPTSVGKGSSKRRSNYTHDEDNQLCYSWMNISNDPIIGTDQPGKTYWERISRDFHQNINSERTPNSLEHRCGVIIRECMKFHGCFEEVMRRHPSGVP